MRALHVAEFDNRHRRLGRAACRAIHSLFKFGSGIVKGPSAEGKDFSRNRVLAISAHQQSILVSALCIGNDECDLG